MPDGMARYGDWINGVRAPEDFDRALLVESPVVHPAATFRRDVVVAMGGYRDGDFPEDYDLWLRLHAAGHRFRKVPRVLVQMRDRPTRLTRTDARYRAAGFRRVKQDWLAATALATPRRVLVLGGGREAKRWVPWLQAGGHEVVALLDVSPRRIGGRVRGVPVRGMQALASIEAEVGLGAATSAGARQRIRTAITRDRPGWVEGRHWWALG